MQESKVRSITESELLSTLEEKHKIYCRYINLQPTPVTPDTRRCTALCRQSTGTELVKKWCSCRAGGLWDARLRHSQDAAYGEHAGCHPKYALKEIMNPVSVITCTKVGPRASRTWYFHLLSVPVAHWVSCWLFTSLGRPSSEGEALHR